MTKVRVSDFHFDLPEDLIAQTPPAVRGSSRMLAVDRATGAHSDQMFAELPQYLHDGDLLILNDSRVIPARLFATRARTTHTQANSPDPTGRIEVLLTQQLTDDYPGENVWSTLVRPSRKIQPGDRLLFADPTTGEPLPYVARKAVGKPGRGRPERGDVSARASGVRGCRRIRPRAGGLHGCRRVGT